MVTIVVPRWARRYPEVVHWRGQAHSAARKCLRCGRRTKSPHPLCGMCRAVERDEREAARERAELWNVGRGA